MPSFEMAPSDKLIMLEYRQAIGWRLGGDSDANAMRTQCERKKTMEAVRTHCKGSVKQRPLYAGRNLSANK